MGIVVCALSFLVPLMLILMVNNLESISIVKTEDVGSHSAGESEGSDDEKKDVDSLGAGKSSK